MMRKAFLNWSSGKDAAYALHCLTETPDIVITRLMTTVNKQFGRVSMHGIREEVLHRQVKALGLDLDIVYLEEKVSMSQYEAILEEQFNEYKLSGIECAIHGDILLKDVKTYKENHLMRLGIHSVFPLWNRDTTSLLEEMIESGMKAMVICVNEKYLDKSFIGRTIDRQFLADLPKGVDPCGENGEFHTFVYDGPMFKSPVHFKLGETVYKTYDTPKQDQSDSSKPIGFWFLDIL